MDWNQFWATIQNWLMTTGIKIVVAIILLFLSFYIINKISNSIAKKGKKLEENKKLDKTVYRTLSYVFKIGLKILVVIALISYLGIDTSGMTALIASLGVGVGLAVNGTLSNLAGGVLLLLTRPFRVDDYISACGYEGTVEDILICHTKLRTTDNRVIYLPNGTLSTSEIVNFTEKDTRRVDLTFYISYDADYVHAENVILQVAGKNEKILKDPACSARVSKHGDSSIEISSKFWCKSEDYWNVYFDMLEQVKTAFDEEHIEVPYNQLDVHVKND